MSDKNTLAPIQSYIEIMRLHSPTGFLLLLWPCWWSIAIAYEHSFPAVEFILFAIGAVVMRGAGCVINDIFDRKIDAKVERTKNRPLPSGKMKLHEAIIFLILLLLIGLAILFFLSNTAIILGYIIVVPVFLYPLMKRITYWPQIFLALTFNWGALMGWAAIRDEISAMPVLLYTAAIFWTLGYDTIYAHQDVKDDAKAGVKSSALKLARRTKKYVALFYTMTTAIIWSIGIYFGAGIAYYVFLFIGAAHLFAQVYSVELHKPEDCMKKFASNQYYGLIIFLAFLSLKF